MQKDVLSGLDPDMLQEVNDVMNNLKGKSEVEVLETLIKLSAQKKNSGKKLTKEQNKALLEAMRESLPFNQRKKFDALLKITEMLSM
ncbi:MAG: hypothetical protein GX308_01050 [Epulopiscium sp.]|nr:hypothetical protein [Candidatus Epulonipiscium sp.]